MSNTSDLDLELLLLKARVAVERMPEDKQIHMRHAQKISFVTGNLRLSGGDERTEERVRVAAGPCPCQACTRSRG